MLKGKICDDGKQTEFLAAKMVCVYTNNVFVISSVVDIH
jgi:hypothetical protein